MSNDSLLKEAVLDELSWDPRVTAAHIGVTAESGVVTLTGQVGAYAEKHAAEMAAGRVKGVPRHRHHRLPAERRHARECRCHSQPRQHPHHAAL